ncbi:PfkB family carbohydrate kinase [Undibacterium sp. Di24W]|uniref:PfkB family carbohydrate kinase n=1 Tax=Undibacterium sp. Di24W TaxID=3413033 RepID=UPI003BF1B19C
MNKKPNILIYGEALIHEFSGQKQIGGAPFNVARALSLLGDTPLLISRLGNDANAQLIQAEMLSIGLMSEGIQIDAVRPTGRILASISDSGDVANHCVEVPRSQVYDFIEEVPVTDLLDQYFQETPPDLIYFGSLMERAPRSKQTLLSLLESDLTEGTTKFFDLYLSDETVSAVMVSEALNYADIVKLNERALRFVIANCCQLASSLDSELSMDIAGLQIACELLMGQFFMQAVIVTLGEKGYFYFDANSQSLSNLSNDEVQFTTDAAADAAGTAFSAFFIHGWNQSWRMQKTLAAAHDFATEIANLADATTVSPEFYQVWRKRIVD